MNTLSTPITKNNTKTTTDSLKKHSSEHVKDFTLKEIATVYHQLKALKSHGSPTAAQIQEITEKTFNANRLLEKRQEQLANEQQQLKIYSEHIWKTLEVLVLPLWNVSEELSPVYEELASINNDLDEISSSTSLTAHERSKRILECQQRLHAVENTYVKNEKFVPKNWSPNDGLVPSGGAMCSNILNKCYKKVHVLLETESDRDPALATYINQLEHIISELVILRGSYDFGFELDSMELQNYQQQVNQIDSLRVDGKFLDEHGNIPAGQADLHFLLEQSYNLIHDCVVLLEDAERPSELNHDTDIIDNIISELSETTKNIWTYTKASTRQLSAISKENLKAMAENAYQGVSKVKEYLKEPTNQVNTTVKKLASISREALATMARVYAELEPVDISLEAVQEKLETIRSTLYGMRNEIDTLFVKRKVDGDSRSVKEMISGFSKTLEDLHESLDEIDKSRVDGYFVTSNLEKVTNGQDHLRSLLDECYCILYEVKDRMIVE